MATNKNLEYLEEAFLKTGNRELHNPKSILVSEGKISNNFYYIKQGCLRSYVLNDGKENCFQFHFENSLIMPESAWTDKPAPISIETIEPSEIYSLSKQQFLELHKGNVALQEEMEDYKFQKLIQCRNQLLSHIREKPFDRYVALMEHHPLIPKRVPHQYIASYLGITSVSLSRIKNRMKHI